MANFEVPVKKSSDGDMVVFGAAFMLADPQTGKVSIPGTIITTEVTKDLLVRLEPATAALLNTNGKLESNHQLFVVTDRGQAVPRRVFSGRTISHDEKTGKTTVLIDRTINLDKNANPAQAVEILDTKIEIELNQGSITQPDVDRLQSLIKSGKLVKVQPARNAELDALLAKEPSGRAEYETAQRTPIGAVEGSKGLAI